MVATAISLSTLVNWCNSTLKASDFSDYCPNGLQIEGKAMVAKVVTGVTANQALIDAAIAAKADAIIVHHGLFWKGDDPCITSIKAARIKALLQHNISLLAYHLPLDAHPTLGNNAALGALLGANNIRPVDKHNKHPLILQGDITAVSPATFAAALSNCLQPPVHIASGKKVINSVAWCTGAAQDFIDQAFAAGADAFISGEISERTVHIAQELGIDYYACGHHTTETGGVRQLASALAEQFAIDCQFINIPCAI